MNLFRLDVRKKAGHCYEEIVEVLKFHDGLVDDVEKSLIRPPWINKRRV